MNDKYNFTVIHYANISVYVIYEYIFENGEHKEKKVYFCYQGVLANTTYILSDKSVEVNAYITQDENQDFNLTNAQWDQESNSYIFLNDSLNQKFNKAFRN